MKEFLKSFRRKLAFLLAVLLVLGNVNWEAMVRAEVTTVFIMPTIMYGDTEIQNNDVIDSMCYGEVISLNGEVGDLDISIVYPDGISGCLTSDTNRLNATGIFNTEGAENTSITVTLSVKEDAKVKYTAESAALTLTFSIKQIMPASMGAITCQLYDGNAEIESTQMKCGKNYELQFENNIVEGEWSCSSSNTDIIEVSAVQDVPDTSKKKVSLSVKAAGESNDENPLVTLTITKQATNENYTNLTQEIPITKIAKGEQEDFTLQGEDGNSLPASVEYDVNKKITVKTSISPENEDGYSYDYGSDNEAVVRHSSNGDFDILGIGNATITVTRKHNAGFYEDKAVPHSIEVTAKDSTLMTGVSLKQGETALVTDAEGNYNIDGSISEQTIELSPVGMVDGASVSYTITAGNEVAVIEGSTLKINASKTGAVTVKATATKANYANTEKEIKISVNKIDPEITVTDDTDDENHTIEFADTDDQFVAVTASGPDGISFEYQITENTALYETTDTQGKYKIKGAGTIKVTVTSSGTELYNPISTEHIITISENPTPLFSGITIDGAEDSEAGKSGTITYSPAYATEGVGVSHIPNSQLDGKAITYEYSVDHSDISTIDKDTGNLKIKKAGNVVITVKATLTNYAPKELHYALTINKANQELTFDKNNISGQLQEITTDEYSGYQIYYGIENFTFPVTVSHECDSNCGSKSVQYSVIDGDSFAVVDSNGMVTLNNGQLANATLPVTIGIQASKEACDCYKSTNAVYSFRVVQYVPDSTDNYTLEETPTNGWFSSAVTIKPKEAGAKIGTQKWGTFSDSVKVVADGVYNNLKYFVRRSDNVIYELPVETIQIDKTAPTYPPNCIEYKTPETLKTISETLTLGFYKAPTLVTLKAKDDGSGVTKFTWWPDGKMAEAKDVTDHIIHDTTSQEYSVTIEIPDGYKNTIYFKAYDNVGNEGLEQNGTRQVIVEDDVPVWIQEEYGTENRQDTLDYDDCYYYNGTASLTLGIEEENFDASDFNNTNYNIATFKINGSEESQDGLWSQMPDTNRYTRQITFSDEGDYTVDLTYTDPSKNGTIRFTSKRIIVDKTAPIRNVSYGEYAHVTDSSGTSITDYNEAVENQNVNLYFGEQANVKVTVKDANFCAGRMFVYLGKDGQEPTTHISGVSWEEQEDGSYCATICLNENGKYRIKVTGKDYANNEMDEFLSETIIVDKDKPQVNVEFSDNIDKNVKDGVWYNKGQLSEDGVATITVITNNFRVSDFDIDFTGSEHLDDTTKTEYITYLKTDSNWVHDGNKHTASLKFDKSKTATYNMTIYFTGLNKKVADTVNEKLIIDLNAPTLVADYETEGATITENGSTRYVYGGATTVTLNLTEDYFAKDDVILTVLKDGVVCPDSARTISDWSSVGTMHTKTIELGTGGVDGDYQIKMTYTDRSGNKMTDFVSKYIIIDTKKPVIRIEYASSDPTAVNGTYYGSNRSATITVQDRTILDAAKLNWKFTAADVKGDTVSIPEGKESAWSKTGNYTWTKTIDFSTDAKYDFTVAPVDILCKTDSKHESFTIDKAKPTNLTIRYSDTENWYDNVLRSISFGYYNEPITVTLTATDVTSPVQSFTWSYARQGDNTSIVETDGGTISKGSTNFKQEGSTATATFTLPREEAKQYRGNISFTVMDMANHSESKADAERVVVYDSISPTRTIAFTDPVRVVKTATKETVSSYDPYQKQDLTLYYNTDMVATFTVTEANFYPQDMLFYVNNELVSDLTWAHTAGTDVYTAEIPFTKNGSYVIKIAEYSDRSKNEVLVAYESNQIVVDKDTPTLDVKFSENIAKNAKDNILYNQGQITEDGKATITVVCNNFRASDFILNLEGSEHLDDATKNEYITYLKTDSNWVHEGNVHTAVLTFDKSKIATYNMSLHFTGLNKLETETIAEKLIMDVNVPTLETVYEAEGGTIKESGSTRYVYGGATTVTLNLTEDYFMEKDVVISVIKDGNACPNSDCTISEWVSNGTKHTKTIELGTGDVDGDYQIFMSYTDRSGNAMESLVSRYIIVDTKKPVIKLDYAANDPDVLNSSFYGSNRTATLTVQDRTIVETEKLSWTFTALNMLGQTVTIPEENITDWALDTKTHTWTRVVKLSVDAIYSFSLNGTDALGNTSDTPIMQNYTMDTTAPVDLKIDYSEGGNWVNNVLGAISFGYYKTPITVTLTAKDITSPIDYFDWTYTKRAESNNTPATAGERITSFTQSGDTATATFTLTPEQAAQYCGNITFTVTNKAGHQSTVKADENRVIVADTITPTRVVEFTPATQVINKTSRQTVETYDPNSKQDLILFYDKPMTITLKVTEANFYPQDAVVTVNDAATDLTWTQNGDEYTTTVTFSTDGDYVLKVAYSDRSGNAMETYESSQITIDTVSPTISVDIVGSSSTGEYDGTKYYSTNTSAIITIVEHNFRAADVTGSIVALSSAEQGVGIQDFAAFLSNEANWVTEGDTHIASYPMTTDATYNFQVEYTDLAKHSVSAATGKYCVDKEAPTNVSLTYSTPVVETLLEAISFKFYNAQATVSVAAIDETAGVNKIVYSLLKADGASDTNLELLEQTITEETFTYSNGRREATAQFKLPASELRAGTQFNGTIKLIVYDRAMNNVAYENNERVIIDNIAPQLDIQYNDSTNERDNILYYGEEIRATLHMNEANFYRDDVKVTVSRNNGGFEPITVNWSDTNADVHIGNFTLSEDGDYVVMVEYADKSTNQMVSYTSEQMTIDTDMPVVTISGVENRKPYASGTVGFTVSVSDTNLDSDSFAPQFSAWVKEGNTIVQKDMFELGSVTVGNDKDSCTYVVDNLPEDGIYTISTSVMDMVGHTVDSMHMDNENGTENDFVRFSVNRNGSTYYIDDATTLGMLGSFVPYDKAGNVVVREVNPTALNDVTVTMFKDEKTIALEENSNFAFNLQHNEGEWYEYSYTIYRTNFEEDGIYNILLHSKDEAEHVAENTLEEKNVTISFAIDSTNPVLIISNLEDGATYNANSYTVYMQASDNLKLSEAVVSVDDKKVGSWTEAEQTLSDDDTYEFTINENNRAQKVSVSLVDKAGNRTTQDYSVTVTTNAFIRVINNKPLLFGIVGGATGAVVVPAAGIALFGKKKLFFVLLNKLKGVFIR